MMNEDIVYCIISYDNYKMFITEEHKIVKDYIALLETLTEVSVEYYDIHIDNDINYLNEMYVKNSDSIIENIEAISQNFQNFERYKVQVSCDQRYCLLYREDIEKCILTEHTQEISNIIDSFLFFEYIKGYNIPRDKFLKLKDFISEKTFIDSEELRNKLDSIEDVLNINKETLEEKIDRLILSNYDFYIEYKTKISEITTFIEMSINEVISLKSINKILANIMNKNGISKKRYTDGMYYIGIKKKFNMIVNYSPIEF